MTVANLCLRADQKIQANSVQPGIGILGARLTDVLWPVPIECGVEDDIAGQLIIQHCTVLPIIRGDRRVVVRKRRQDGLT